MRVLVTQMHRTADPNRGARLRVSDLRALMLESDKCGQQAGASEAFVQELAAKYGVHAAVLQKVLKYNKMPSRGDSDDGAMERLGFRSEDTGT